MKKPEEQIFQQTLKKTLAHYTPRTKMRGQNSEILDWSSRDSQLARFASLHRAVDLNGQTILDIGCGLADLRTWMLTQKINFQSYTGVDLVPEMIQLAQSQQPEAHLLACDIFRENPFKEHFSLIFCSGVFNLNTSANWPYLTSTIPKMIELLAPNGQVVINLLHQRTQMQYPHCFYYAPEAVKELFETHFSLVTIVDDYLINDFTVIATSPR